MLTFLIVSITICILFLIAGIGLGTAIERWRDSKRFPHKMLCACNKKEGRICKLHAILEGKDEMTRNEMVEDASEGRR